MTDRIRSVLEPHVASGSIPGVVTLVSRRGEVHVQALGLMSLESAEPMSQDAIFRISSMTKPVTAAATLMLIEQGTISLDDPIGRWLPELAAQRVLRSLNSQLDDTEPAGRTIKVRDLLSFTSGFGQLYGPPHKYPILQESLELGIRMGPPAPELQPEPDEWLRRLASLPLMQQPGHSWLYDTAYDVLGILVARASGMPFATFLHERVFEPLGMRDTAFFVPPDKQHRLATAYWPDSAANSLGVSDDPLSGQWSREPRFNSGAGGLVSTCNDYLAFANMLLGQGTYDGGKLLSAESVKLMTSDSLTAAQKSRSGAIPLDFSTHTWGMGLAVATADGQEWPEGSYGWSGGLGTTWDSNPQDGLIAICLTQVAMASPTSMRVFEDFWQALRTDGS